jgi:hypothetical protein
MYELLGATLVTDLATSASELEVIRQRVAGTGALVPIIDLGSWSGLASLACRLSLSELRREVEIAAELLRCAADLTSAAAFEARSNA